MATDNRHRPGFALTCKKCSRRGSNNGGQLVRGDFTSIRAVPVRCSVCGHEWVSQHLSARWLPFAHEVTMTAPAAGRWHKRRTRR